MEQISSYKTPNFMQDINTGPLMQNSNNQLKFSLGDWAQPSTTGIQNSLSANPAFSLPDAYKLNDLDFGKTGGGGDGTLSLWDKFNGGKDGKTGTEYGNTLGNIAQLGTAAMNGYLGFKQLGLAKDNLAFQKDSFSKQFENQRSLTNSQLRDRQAGRVSANPGGYQSVDDYMKANGI